MNLLDSLEALPQGSQALEIEECLHLFADRCDPILARYIRRELYCADLLDWDHAHLRHLIKKVALHNPEILSLKLVDKSLALTVTS